MLGCFISLQTVFPEPCGQALVGVARFANVPHTSGLIWPGVFRHNADSVVLGNSTFLPYLILSTKAYCPYILTMRALTTRE